VDEQPMLQIVESTRLKQTFDRADTARLKADIELQGRREYFGLRKSWSAFLMRTLFVLVGFQIALVLAVGSGRLDFQPYHDVLDLVIGTTVLQVIGMCVVVVKFVFPDWPD
jgi:hypothetical protein